MGYSPYDQLILQNGMNNMEVDRDIPMVWDELMLTLFGVIFGNYLV